MFIVLIEEETYDLTSYDQLIKILKKNLSITINLLNIDVFDIKFIYSYILSIYTKLSNNDNIDTTDVYNNFIENIGNYSQDISNDLVDKFFKKTIRIMRLKYKFLLNEKINSLKINV